MKSKKETKRAQEDTSDSEIEFRKYYNKFRKNKKKKKARRSSSDEEAEELTSSSNSSDSDVKKKKKIRKKKKKTKTEKKKKKKKGDSKKDNLKVDDEGLDVPEYRTNDVSLMIIDIDGVEYMKSNGIYH